MKTYQEYITEETDSHQKETNRLFGAYLELLKKNPKDNTVLKTTLNGSDVAGIKELVKMKLAKK